MNRIKQAFARFMMGRYGTDKLNTWILGAGVILCLVSVFIPYYPVNLVLTTCSYVLMILAIFPEHL